MDWLLLAPQGGTSIIGWSYLLQLAIIYKYRCLLFVKVSKTPTGRLTAALPYLVSMVELFVGAKMLLKSVNIP